MTKLPGIGLAALALAAAALVPPARAGDTALTFCNATEAWCPCSNVGAPDAGCADALATSGVKIASVVQTSVPAAATLTGSGYAQASAPLAILIRSGGVEPAHPLPFGDGIRCVAATSLVRISTTVASNGTSLHAFAHGAGPGAFYYQIWYSSAPVSFCDPVAGFNASNGVCLDW